MNLPSKTLALGVMLLCAAQATQLELILDASGSMYGKLPGGQSRIAVARDVLTGFIASLPEDPALSVGLRIYGAKLAEGKGNCEDSHLVFPLQGLDREKLQATVRNTIPRGATPIAYSLQQAARDFKTDSDKKIIVLVTDGQESCGGNLAQSLEAFREGGHEVDLRIIGIDLDEKAQRSFQGMGTFENTTSAAQLAQALGKAVKQVTPSGQQAPLKVQLTDQGKGASMEATVTVHHTLTGTETVLSRESTPGLYTHTLPTGTYSVQIQTPHGTHQHSGLHVNVGKDNTYRFEVGKNNPQVILTLNPATPVMGSVAEVQVQNVPGTGMDGYLTLVHPSLPNTTVGGVLWVGQEAGTFAFQIPEVSAPLQLQYVNHLGEVLGQTPPFTPREVPATLTLLSQPKAGGRLDIAWTGPGNEGDFLTVVEASLLEGTSNPDATVPVDPTTDVATLQLSQETGTFEVRYMTQAGRVLARQAFSVPASR